MTTEKTPADTSVHWPQTAPTAVGAGTAPAVNPVRWSGKKTAVAAALALGLSTVGAVGVAAAHERGASTTSRDGRAGIPGGQGQHGQLPGQPPGQLPGQLPGQPGQQTHQ